MTLGEKFLRKTGEGATLNMSSHDSQSYIHIPSTLNIDLILWHTQLIVCAENVKSWFKSRVFSFTFPAPFVELYV